MVRCGALVLGVLLLLSCGGGDAGQVRRRSGLLRNRRTRAGASVSRVDLLHAIAGRLAPAERSAGKGASATMPSACRYMESCHQCAASADCGWCGDCGRCVEGGASGPAASHCLAWDFDTCSGNDAFADASLKSYEEERSVRDEHVRRFKTERDNYAQANDDVTRLQKLVETAAQAVQTAESSLAGSKQNILPGQKVLSAKTDACSASTKAAAAKAAKVDNATSTIAALDATKKAMETERDQANADGNADRATELQQQIDVTATEITGKQNELTAEKASLANLQSSQTADCAAQAEAASSLSKSEGLVSGAAQQVSGARAQLDASKTALANAKAERTRSKAAALAASERVKQLSSKLADQRAQHTASDASTCTVAATEAAAADAAIKEWKECIDCQEKQRKESA